MVFCSLTPNKPRGMRRYVLSPLGIWEVAPGAQSLLALASGPLPGVASLPESPWHPAVGLRGGGWQAWRDLVPLEGGVLAQGGPGVFCRPQLGDWRVPGQGHAPHLAWDPSGWIFPRRLSAASWWGEEFSRSGSHWKTPKGPGRQISPLCPERAAALSFCPLLPQAVPSRPVLSRPGLAPRRGPDAGPGTTG